MSSEVRPVPRDRADTAWLGVLFLATLLFWGLRVAYWSSVEEQPFSDMENFDTTARGIATAFNFQWTEFWRTYSTPSLVTARALQIILFGDSMLAWRFFLAALTFAGLAWLAYELWKVTGSRWMVAALLIIVALSKPSIFWSLKLAREGFQEALTYWTVAAALAAFRKDRPMVYLVLGLVVAVNFLNRPNALLIVPVIALLLVGIHIWNRRSADDDPHTRRFSLGHKLGAFLLGILALWGPWIARSIAIYGEPVLLSTQGPYAVLWELGEIRVRLRDGREIVTHVNRLQAEAGQFPNDLAASKYANEIAQAWISEHRSELPSLMFARIGGSIGNRDVHLTKVPRDVIFGPPWDSFLLDKGRATTYAGALGLLVLPGLYGWRLLILPAAALIPWLTAAALIGYARWLEPAIPLILFGCIAWIMVGARILARTRMAPVNSVS